MIFTGFRENGFCTVWSVEPGRTGNTTKVRLSTSRKNKQTNEYEQDFSGFCTFIGKAHDKAATLRERDRIKLLSCDVATRFDNEKKIGYVNYKVFDFEMADGEKTAAPGRQSTKQAGKQTAFEMDGDTGDDDFPF